MFRRFHFGALVSALIILATMMVSQAGAADFWNLKLDTATCDSITVSYSTNTTSGVEIIALHGTASSVSPNPYTDKPASSGNVTFQFTPPLPNGTTVTIQADFDDVQFTNASDVGLLSTIGHFALHPDRIQGEQAGIIREVVVTVDCDEELTQEDAPFIGCDDGRLNQLACEPIAIYLVDSDDGLGMDIWYIDPETSAGMPVLYVAAEDLATATTVDSAFCTVATSSDGTTGVYLLADGTLQVINGPDFEDKYFVFTFESGYPSSPTPSTYIGGGLPQAANC